MNDEHGHRDGSSKISDNEVEDTTALTTCQQELAQSKARYLYLNAEFDNYKKRIERERIQWLHSAQADVLCDLLTVVDHFDRALSDEQQKSLSAELEESLKGFELIAKELQKLLLKYDIEEVACTVPFNPLEHEAIMHAPPGKYESGTIVTVLQKGYKRKGQLLRPARVSVAE